MAVASIDLAYKRSADIGIAVIGDGESGAECAFLEMPLCIMRPELVADHLEGICRSRSITTLLIDGPQGWKSPSNGLDHSRLCERTLNTPAKTGEPEIVKPGNYAPFVKFSIDVFERLGELGWSRLMSKDQPDTSQRTVMESFPMSAWVSLGMKPLPAKSKCRHHEVNDWLVALQSRIPVSVTRAPSHDELQALVAGLAGLGMKAGLWDKLRIEGLPPVVLEGMW